MSTAVAHPTRLATATSHLPGGRYDHLFFASMSWLMLATVFVGFGPTYYLAGVFSAPLPTLIIHVHGALFSCWMLLLITQTTLVSVGRLNIHRLLGIAGFLLACAMIVVGVLAANDQLVRESGPLGRDAKFFYIVPMTSMLMFATLIAFAFRARSNPPTHKRLILIATMTLTVAAIARWPFAIVYKHASIATLFSYVFLLMLVIYDLWSTRKVHRATLWAGAFLVFVSQVRLPIGKTAAWHSFASWVQELAR
jgi:hypothetical protein